MYISVFWRSDGAGSATTRNTRGLTRSVIALMVPPLPAPSRPSNTRMMRKPLCLTHSCKRQSSTCSLRSSWRYSLFFIFDLGCAGSLDLSRSFISRNSSLIRLQACRAELHAGLVDRLFCRRLHMIELVLDAKLFPFETSHLMKRQNVDPLDDSQTGGESRDR